MAMKRKYPVGIQSFETIRKDGYLYIDKTALVYKMITEGKPYFLSRPRRFGKSLLISTLQAVFEGRRDLFEAFTTEQGIQQPQLYIAQTDWKWEKHPVLRFDFSKCVEYTLEGLKDQIRNTLSQYETKYGVKAEMADNSIRLEHIILAAHQQTGKRVVVLVDEYDTVMLHNLGDTAKERAIRECVLGTFGLLKAMDDHLQFVLLTGISKFSQMGIFSRLNNLMNISMQTTYDSLCGISEEELATQLRPDIESLAQTNGLSYDEQMAELKNMYDGYHFSRRMTDLYNPFSLMNALQLEDVGSYWFDRGTSSALIEMLAQMPSVDVASIESSIYPSTMFDLPFESFDDPLPILYQSGYLTIKGYERSIDGYQLGVPNNEVRRGFAECLYKHIVGKGNDLSRGVFYQAYDKFRRDSNLPAFIEALKAFFASLPYPWEKDNRNEHYYHSLLYTLLTAFGADVRAEEPTAKGQSDLVLLMPKGIYIMELKYNDTADTALAQIDAKGYADKYALDGRPVTKIGIAFSTDERNISEWKSR